MKVSTLLLVAIASIADAANRPNEVNALAAQGLHNLEAYYSRNALPNPRKCTLDNVAVRREWSVPPPPSLPPCPSHTYRSTLTKPERRAYIAAVQCLAKRPARTPAAIASGAKSRYDDLVVTHIQQAYTIHGTASFLSWHRYYTWAFEQMLRKECGYKGYQPYYNWGWWADNPKKSPFFDGSDTSMSGDGEYVPGRKSVCFPSTEMCYIQLQPGSGGGCVTSGPFKEYVSHNSIFPAL
jgi:tyrosinase